MSRISFSKAHYITLGKDFCYAEFCINESRVRFDWRKQKLDDIHNHRWEIIREQIREEMNFSKNATHDFNSLQSIAEARPDEIWITRYNGLMWWGFMSNDQMDEDKISKYRNIRGCWKNSDTAENLLKIVKGKKWSINNKAESVAKTLKYCATECSVNDRRTLELLLNNEL